MYSFNEFLVRRDEASFNVADYIPGIDKKPASGNPPILRNALKVGGAAVGAPIAAASGIATGAAGVLGALRNPKVRAFKSASFILNYLGQNPRLKGAVLDKTHQVIQNLESDSEMGVIRGQALPNVDPSRHSTLGDVASAAWKGIMTSAHNLVDTIFGSVRRADKYLNFREAFKHFFEALGQLPKSQATALLNNFYHVLNRGGTGQDLQRDIWESTAFTRSRNAAALGTGPSMPDAEINSHDTAKPWVAKAIKKRNKKKKHRFYK